MTAAGASRRIMGSSAIAAVASLAAVLLVTPASAQPGPGIVRPENEASLAPPELGAQLFAANCAKCHGIDGRGIGSTASTSGDRGRGPPVRGVGALAADFYLGTGYMPLADPDDQPTRKRPPFSEREIRALVDYVAGLGNGPPIPDARPEEGSLPEGRALFAEHCAGCHQIVARGGVVTGARVPPLEDATATQVAQAVRIGPYLMPRFSEADISDAELDSIVRYVDYTKHPVDRGGWGIGNLGPVPEGMVTWMIGALLLVAACVVIGQRLRT
jgi:ubiquinol-cytochrome c reductase cytochrome c subunit